MRQPYLARLFAEALPSSLSTSYLANPAVHRKPHFFRFHDSALVQTLQLTCPSSPRFATMSTASLQIPQSNADASWSDWIWSTDHQRYYRCKTTVGGERQFQYAGSSEILRANNAQSVQGSEGIRSLPRSGYDYQARATQHFSLPEDQSSNYHLYGQNSEGSSQENSHLSEDVEQQNEIAPSYYPGYGSYGYSSQPAREGTLTSGPFLGDQQSILSRRQLAVRYRTWLDSRTFHS